MCTLGQHFTFLRGTQADPALHASAAVCAVPCRVKGIFQGASFVFFSFIGFDCVSTLAEEVKNPAVDMPVGIVGCISFVTVVCKYTRCCMLVSVQVDQSPLGIPALLAMLPQTLHMEPLL
jgi:amino acid transporter